MQHDINHRGAMVIKAKLRLNKAIKAKHPLCLEIFTHPSLSKTPEVEVAPPSLQKQYCFQNGVPASSTASAGRGGGEDGRGEGGRGRGEKEEQKEKNHSLVLPSLEFLDGILIHDICHIYIFLYSICRTCRSSPLRSNRKICDGFPHVQHGPNSLILSH